MIRAVKVWTQLILPDRSDAAFTEYALLEELTQDRCNKTPDSDNHPRMLFRRRCNLAHLPRRMQHAQQSPQKIFGLQRPVIDGLRRWRRIFKCRNSLQRTACIAETKPALLLLRILRSFLELTNFVGPVAQPCPRLHSRLAGVRQSTPTPAVRRGELSTTVLFLTIIRIIHTFL
jgi:hypothetical protein